MDKRRLFTNLKKEVAILASCAMILGVVPGTALMSNAESYKMRDKTTTTVDEKKDISQCECWIQQTLFEYTGSPITPRIYVTDKSDMVEFYLNENKDFTVEYSDNINSGTAKATITGIGDYSGTVVLEFKIYNINDYDNKRPNLTFVRVDDIPLDSNGKVANGNAKVTYGFTIDPSIIEAEFYTEVDIDDKITAISFGPCETSNPEAKVTEAEDRWWVPDTSAGETAFTYTTTIPTVGVDVERGVFVDGDVTYVEGSREGDKARFYGLSIINLGGFYIRTNNGNCIEVPITKDSIGKTYTVSGIKEDDEPDVDPVVVKSIVGAEIKSPAQTYTGAALEPNLEIKVDGIVLKKGTDYDVVFKNNVNAGKATAKITGKGNYKDSVEYEFSITPQSGKITVSSNKKLKYNAKVQSPKSIVVNLNGKKLNTKDYSIKYSQPKSKNAGTYSFTVTLKGNYKGSFVGKYTITKAKNPIIVKLAKSSINVRSGNSVLLKSAVRVSKAQGNVTYTKVSGDKNITVNKKTGKITVSKNAKKKTYNVKIKVEAAGNKNYEKGSKNVTVSIKVK